MTDTLKTAHAFLTILVQDPELERRVVAGLDKRKKIPLVPYLRRAVQQWHVLVDANAPDVLQSVGRAAWWLKSNKTLSNPEIAAVFSLSEVALRRIMAQQTSDDPAEWAQMAAQTEQTHLPLTWGGVPLVENTEVPRRKRLRVVLLVLAVLVTAGAVLWAIWGQRFWERSFADHLAESPKTLVFKSSNAAEIQNYMASTYQQQVLIPVLEGVDLKGLGEVKLANGKRLPVLLYPAPVKLQPEIAVVTMPFDALNTYAPDEFDARFYQGIEQEERKMLLQKAWKNTRCLVWRWRDDVYFAFIPQDAVQAFVDRLYKF